MKLRNKKTGEIIIPSDYTFTTYDDGIRYGRHTYYSLAELNEDWEDVPEEPKEYWYISAYGNLAKTDVMTDLHRGAEEIGNLFSTIEEAEKVVEKLKAFKRLKDKGFSFNDWDWRYQNIGYNLDCTAISEEDVIEAEKDLDLLFGGEE